MILKGFWCTGQPDSSKIMDKALRTPTWYAARAPPPVRINPVFLSVDSMPTA